MQTTTTLLPIQQGLIQLHSYDYRIRLSEQALHGIGFQHLYTVDDPAVALDATAICQAPVQAGTTEWSATYRGLSVSLAWDWVLTHDTTVQTVTQVEPRTNLQVLDAKGYDLGSAAMAACLWRVIGHLPWQAQVLSSALGTSTAIPTSTSYQ